MLQNALGFHHEHAIQMIGTQEEKPVILNQHLITIPEVEARQKTDVGPEEKVDSKMAAATLALKWIEMDCIGLLHN